MTNNEEEILDFFRNAVDFPDQLKDFLSETSLPNRARLLAFLQTRDTELYKKVEELT